MAAGLIEGRGLRQTVKKRRRGVEVLRKWRS
jgi:hypothetical protein